MAEPTEKEPRGPTNLRIKFRSASLDQFIERYSVDVSRGGIFIRTREPLSVGTRLRLEFQLLDAAPLLAGEGTVVWIREPDPLRENVTPGMGVRFDKLTPESQPTLEKILAEKTRLQQAGGAPTGLTKTGGGMAVRRSGVFPAVDAAALAKVASTASTAPTAPTLPVASTPPGAPSGAAEQTPISNPSRSGSPFTSVSKTSFMASRTAAPAPVANAGGPFRARTTTASGVRPAPVPSALFEPPTADDIDKALEALAETSGTHVPPPISPTSDVQPTPLADPSAEAPRFVSDDASNEPTRVVDVVEELVGGTAAHPPALSESAPDHPATASDDGNVETDKHKRSEASPRAASLDAPIELQLQDVEPAQPLPPEPRVRKAGPVPKSGGVDQVVAPEKSTRFRAASSAYPTLKRRRLTVLGVTVIVVGSVTIIGVLKLHWKERLFPPAPPTAPAAVVEAPPPAAPAPAAVNPAPSTAAAAPEGAGGGTEAKGEIAAPAPAPTPAPASAPATPSKVEPPPEEKAAPEEHASTKHAAVRRRAHEAPAGSTPAESKPPAGAPGAAPEKSAAGEKATGDKAAEKAPAKIAEKAPAKATEKAADEKAATDKSAATAAAPPPTEAAPPAPPAPVLKVTSTPAGAEVIIDGSSVGTTPFTSKTIDPAAPHAVTVKKDGYESAERMIGGLDWSRPRGNGAPSLKVNVKLRRAAAPPAAPKENAEPADDSGGPYIKEIKPDAP